MINLFRMGQEFSNAKWSALERRLGKSWICKHRTAVHDVLTAIYIGGPVDKFMAFRH